FLGQGLCAGARDAANLAWKLALALQAPDRSAILHTYGPERKPHAREFVDLAVQMGRIIQVVDPKVAAQRDAELKAQGLIPILSHKEPRLMQPVQVRQRAFWRGGNVISRNVAANAAI